jgi:hypothetical protein
MKSIDQNKKGCKMDKYFVVLIISLFSVCLFAETVVKNSASFPCPWCGIGIIDNKVDQHSIVSFKCASQSVAGGMVKVSWFLPSPMEKGEISFYSASGVLIKTLYLNSPSGSVVVNFSGSRIGRGIYLARFSSGTVEISRKIIFY